MTTPCTSSSGATGSASAGTSANSAGSYTSSVQVPSSAVATQRARPVSSNQRAGTNASTIGASTAAMPSTAIGTAQARWTRSGALTASEGSFTLSGCVSITEVTTAAGWIAGLAIVALVATGWRKPARVTADPARARQPSRAPVGLEVTDVEAPTYRRPRLYRRVWAVLASSVLAVWVGAITATVIGFVAALMVIRLTEMLNR